MFKGRKQTRQLQEIRIWIQEHIGGGRYLYRGGGGGGISLQVSL